MLDTAVILAGGFGTRLKTVIADLPKPMAPINENPFLDYQFQFLKHHGIKKVILSIGHMAEKIQEYYKNNFQGIDISYVIENTPLGTGGGIRLALKSSGSREVFVLNGDSFFDVDLAAFYKQHQISGADL